LPAFTVVDIGAIAALVVIIATALWLRPKCVK
jgi:hypothetical protein